MEEKKEGKLTFRQRRFCDEYLKTGNATKSAVKAGYKESSARAVGSQNLRKPAVKKYLSDKIGIKEKKPTADIEEVMIYLTSVMRGEGDVNERERLRAAELLYKKLSFVNEDKNKEDNIIKVRFAK